VWNSATADSGRGKMNCVHRLQFSSALDRAAEEISRTPRNNLVELNEPDRRAIVPERINFGFNVSVEGFASFSDFANATSVIDTLDV
jgi:hypothetical protein